MGHPEHDILFIATQVARAAGLKNPSHASMAIAKGMEARFVRQLGSLFQAETLKKPKGVQATSWLFTEEATYKMLMSGRSPKSEPFRKWVTEVVLPTIRKTGKFDIHEAEDQTSQDFAGQLKKTLDLIRSSPMMATLSPAPLARAPRPKATGSPT